MTNRGWWRPPVLAVAAVSAAVGFGQFGVTAALGDVAEAFGEPAEGIAVDIGMTGTRLGVGLAIIRLSSLLGLPVAALADRHGRRTVLVSAAAGGLTLTVLAATSPSYWWFVAVFAAGRPLLTAATAVAGVTVAEETRSRDRAAGVALVGAAYAIGTGILSGVRALGLEFRVLFATAAIPLLALLVVARRLPEPVAPGDRRRAAALPGRIPRRWWRRLAVVCTLHLAVGFLTGPVNTYLFLYGESVLGLSPVAVTAVFIGSGATGLAGLLAGRWLADTAGRRPAAGAAMVLAGLAGALTYWGGPVRLVVGYPLMVAAASAFTPAAGALDAELFGQSVRAGAAGWLTTFQVVGAVAGLLTFGLLLETTGDFRGAGIAVGATVATAALLYATLPETRGRELDPS